MFGLKRLMTAAEGRSNTQHFPDSEFQSTEKASRALELQYEEVIATQLRRFGIGRDCVSLEVRRAGESDGLDVFAGMLRVLKWDRVSTLRLLLGLPMLDMKVRQAVSATWLADVSHFSGLWLNTSQDLHRAEGAGELRDLIVQLAPPRKTMRSADAGLGINCRAAHALRDLLNDSPTSGANSTEMHDESAVTNP